jgi:hypothetical protein
MTAQQWILGKSQKQQHIHHSINSSMFFFFPHPSNRHTLSVQKDVNPQSPLFSYNVRGKYAHFSLLLYFAQHHTFVLGHCSAVADAEPSDPPELKEVRAKIAATLKKWLL